MSFEDSLLHQLMHLYWLRPETAIFSTINIIGTRPYLKSGSVVDVCCGDGLFSFHLLGGRLHQEFDVFQSLFKTKGEEPDIYNQVSPHYHPPLLEPAAQKIDLGVDLKPALLAKAAQLNFYNLLEQRSLEEPWTAPPLSFDSIFCFHSLNHLKNLNHALSQITAMGDSGSTYFFTCYMPCFTDFYHQIEQTLTPASVKILERKMRQLWPSLFSLGQWRDLFASHGLEEKTLVPLIDKKFVSAWNIGTRPLVGPLMKMSQLAKQHDQSAWFELKEEWVSTFCTLGENFLKPATHVEDAGMVLFILEKTHVKST